MLKYIDAWLLFLDVDRGSNTDIQKLWNGVVLEYKGFAVFLWFFTRISITERFIFLAWLQFISYLLAFLKWGHALD